MKKLILLTLISIFTSSYASAGMHYTVNSDGTDRNTGRGDTGCVLGDTLVYLENGKKIKISEVGFSNELMPLEYTEQPTVWSVVSGPEKKKVLKITTDTGKTIVATKNHPFYREGLLYKADEFKVNDKIDTLDGMERVVKIEQFFTQKNVYNVILGSEKIDFLGLGYKTSMRMYPFQGLSASQHKLILNGFISGDLTIQKVQY